MEGARQSQLHSGPSIDPYSSSAPAWLMMGDPLAQVTQESHDASLSQEARGMTMEATSQRLVSCLGLLLLQKILPIRFSGWFCSLPLPHIKPYSQKTQEASMSGLLCRTEITQ